MFLLSDTSARNNIFSLEKTDVVKNINVILSGF